MRYAILPVVVLAMLAATPVMAADQAPPSVAPDSKQVPAAAPEQKVPVPAPLQMTQLGNDPRGGDSALSEGVYLFKDGRYPDSADRLSAAVGFFPNYPRAILLLANSYFAMGNFESAAEQLFRGVQLKGALDSEQKELKEIWRDYALYRERVGGLGRLAEKGDKPRLTLLYGFYYALGGYRELANDIFRTIPKGTEERKAAKTIMTSQLPDAPWVDLPPVVIPKPAGKGGKTDEDAPEAFIRHVTIGFGIGGTVITGQIRSSSHSALEGYSGTRFYVGFLIDKLVLDVNFNWTYLHGDLMIPGIGYGKDVGLNLFAVGVEATYHFLRKPGTKGIDPSVRVGYSFLDLETNSWYYSGGYYYSGVNAGIGQGPLVGVSVDYVFAYAPVDFSLGLDLAYQVYIIHNDYGHLDGGGLNIQAKFAFTF